MTCNLTYSIGATCKYTTKLGLSAIHRFFFEVKYADGTIMSYPTAGYITGTTINLLSDYNLVGIPRNINSANLSGSLAFGSSKTYRWLSTGLSTDSNKEYYSFVSTSNPVVSGEGYFVFTEQRQTLPELGNYGNVSEPVYSYQLK